MKQINELYESSYDVMDRINESMIDEGLKDKLSSIFTAAKEKLGKIVDKIIQGAQGIYAKIKCYLIPVGADGEPLPTVGSYTSGLAYKEGAINKSTTLVCVDAEGQKLTGCKTKPADAYKLYTKENTLQYWSRVIKENANGDEANVNEVKLASEDPMAKYNKICDDKELEDEIKYALESDGASLMIWGAPGIGKTAILRTVLEKFEKFKGYNLICKTLSNETPDNFTLPSYVEVTDKAGNITRRADDIPKTWLPVYKPTGNKEIDAEADKLCGKGLLFIDELSRATPQVLNVVLPLVNEHIFNGWNLGSGWSIICASNRDEDEMGGQTSIGNALSNRFAHIYYEPTVNTWRNWADQQKYISPLLLQWLSMPEKEEFSGGKFYYMDPNETLEDGETKLMCTPRAWTNAMRELAVRYHTGELEGFGILDIPEHILKRVLNKYVPSSAVDAFWGFLSIIKKIGDFDRAVREVWSNGGKNLKIDAKDLRLVALPLAQMIICARDPRTLPTEKEFDNLADWTISTGNDQLAAYVFNIFKNVYGDKLLENDRELIYGINFVYTKSPAEDQSRLDSLFKETLAKYGLKSCADIPNYREAVKRIAAKYRDIFSSATVNGKPALA